MNIYVGNLPYAATETDLEELFREYGPIAKAAIIRDRHDGRSKGFGFVEMENREDGERAIAALDGYEMMGRPLKVNPARPRQDRAPSRNRREARQSSRSIRTASRQSDASPEGTFHNPYTFIPTPPRPLKNLKGKFAGDFNPLEHDLDHATLKNNLWTGHIPIKLTTGTPLVLLKTDGADPSSEDHHIYDVLDYLPESSLRGMLRSAYEVVTNSRYACFRNNDRLRYRIGWDKREHEKSPDDLLDRSLKPAGKLCELSPTDRLFGWVSQNTKGDDTAPENEGGYKSRIRVVCEDSARASIVKLFDGATLSLTILGEPKPAQGRFYVAADNRGTPQMDGLNKDEAGYSTGKGLRGRKWYWHHKELVASEAAEYWKPSVEDRTQVKHNNRYQEYRRPNGRNGNPQTDSQNRSITGWIKPDTVFKASLYVQNLQREELGALLWLLTLNNGINDKEEKRYYRLGYGKPLGFGSVRVEVDTERLGNGCLPLGTGEHWKAYYTDVNLSTSSPSKLDDTLQREYIEKFKVSLLDAYKGLLSEGETADVQRFRDLPFIDGFLQVLSGPKKDAPIHYPRQRPKPHPKGENFRWFTANDNGSKLALPAVTAKKGLPYQP